MYLLSMNEMTKLVKEIERADGNRKDHEEEEYRKSNRRSCLGITLS